MVHTQWVVVALHVVAVVVGVRHGVNVEAVLPHVVRRAEAAQTSAQARRPVPLLAHAQSILWDFWSEEKWGVGRGVWDLGCGAWGVGPGVWGVGPGVWGLGCGAWGVGCGVWGMGCGAWGVGPGLWGLGCGARGVGRGVWGVGRGAWSLGDEGF